MKFTTSTVLVLFAAVIGWFASEYRIAIHDEELRAQVASRILNYSEDGAFSEISNPYSFNDVLESEGDLNHDGRPDEWIVVVRPGAVGELTYVMNDLDADEQPNTFTLSTQDLPIAYQSRDANGDGEADRQQVSLPVPASAASGFDVYFDINMDGKIDIWKTGHNFDTGSFDFAYLIVNSTVVKVLTDQGGDYDLGFQVSSPSGNNFRVVFDHAAGVWEEAP